MQSLNIFDCGLCFGLYRQLCVPSVFIHVGNGDFSFKRVREVAKSKYEFRHVRPSVRPRETNQLLRGRFSLKFYNSAFY